MFLHKSEKYKIRIPTTSNITFQVETLYVYKYSFYPWYDGVPCVIDCVLIESYWSSRSCDTKTCLNYERLAIVCARFRVRILTFHSIGEKLLNFTFDYKEYNSMNFYCNRKNYIWKQTVTVKIYPEILLTLNI